MERVLVVEDDKRIGEHVCGLVQSTGFIPRLVSDMSALEACIDDKLDLHAIILDRLLAGLDTKGKVADLKKRWPSTPILVLSAINTPLERAELLNLGVDDYLGKPFLSQELLARIRALTRRFNIAQANYREIGGLILDIPKRILIGANAQEQLPAKEFLLIKILSDEIGRVVSKSELLDIIWNGAFDVETNVVEATIANLRKRMSGLGAKVEIRNSRNIGYWIEE